jgi:F-type H+-transporting ATPase subunit alpha
LAQYRELAAFAQFGSDLDKATQAQLARGERLTELLKQGQFKPLTVEKQVLLVYAGTRGFLDDMTTAQIHEFEPGLYQFFDSYRPALLKEIREKKIFTDALRAEVDKGIVEYKERFKSDKASAA